jgi:hypothetical protein
MAQRLIIKLIITAIVLLSFSASAESQAEKQDTYLSIEQLTRQLEEKYSIHFFYKPEWFESRYFHPSIPDLGLEEVLENINSIAGLSLVRIDSGLYIFVAEKPLPKVQAAGVETDEVLIGNMDEYGKYSKATIRGKILDGMTAKPLPGASVVIEKLKAGAISDKEGNYVLEAPVGEYTVRLSFIGYDDNSRKIKLVGSGILNLELNEKSIKLNEVIISSERAESNVHATQMSIIRLDSRSIKELPVGLGRPDIIKSLTLMPGVQTVGELGTGFNVRGGGADQNLILIEDVPLFNSSHLLGLTSVVNSDGISNFTLYKAGIPAKFGERASSVMDIQMGVNNLDKTTVKGGIGLIDSRIYIETPLINKKLTLLVSARGSYSNWLLHIIPESDLMNSSAGFYDANTFLSYTLNSKNKINFFGYSSGDKYAFTANTNFRYNNLLGSLRWKHTFSNSFYFNLVGGISNYNFNVTESDTTRPWESYRINSAINYKNFKWNFTLLKVNNHSIDFGINSALYKIEPGQLEPLNSETIIEPVLIQQEKAIESAIYVSDNFMISPKISIDFGVRFSVFTYLGPGTVYEYQPGISKSPESITDSTLFNNNEPISSYYGLEPRISVRYTLSDKSSLKFSYNRMHQYINLISNTAVMTPADVWKLSSPYLKPLISDHFAVGYFRNFSGNKIEASVEVYYKMLTNGIDYKNGAKIILNPYLETDLINVNGYNSGIEFYIKKNSGKLTGWASYTYSRSWQKSNGIYEEDKINNNEPFPSNYDRPNNIVVNANYHISRRWRFGSTFTYSTGRPVTLPEYKFDHSNYQLIYYSDRNKYRLPDYHRLDVSLTLDESLRKSKKWKGSWTISVINVYGRNNAYSVYYKKEDHMISNQLRQYDIYRLYIIGSPFPTLTYNFTF